MGQIKTRWFYTELVEHYLRMAVRYEVVSKASSQRWFDITKDWIANLSDKDKKLNNLKLLRKFYNTAEGLYCYQSVDDMYAKRIRLGELEKDFALKCGLIGEDSTGDNALSE